MDMAVTFLFILPSNITKEWFQGYRPTLECVKIHNRTVGYPKIMNSKVYVLIVIMFGQIYILIGVSLSYQLAKEKNWYLGIQLKESFHIPCSLNT